MFTERQMKFFKGKAIANLCGAVLLISLATFAVFFRMNADVQEIFRLQNRDEDTAYMGAGLSFILFILFFCMYSVLLVGGIFCLTSSVIFFKKTGDPLKKWSAPIFERRGKMLCFVILGLLFLISPTVLSRIVYGVFCLFSFTSAVAGVVISKKYLPPWRE